MTVKDRLRPWYRSSRVVSAAVTPSRKPILAVYGNCQAAALATMLAAVPAVDELFRVVRLPGVHEVLPRDLGWLRRVFSRADVVITQRVRSDYRGLPIGTDQMLESVSRSSRVLTYPSMYYRGLHPNLVYVHADGELGTPAPLTEGYHDLRFIALARAGRSGEAAEDWLASHRDRPDFVRTVAHESMTGLESRESGLDVSVSGSIPDAGATAFWTHNHPSNAVMRSARDGVLQRLDLPDEHPSPARELLTSVVAPVSAGVRSALGYEAGGAGGWSVNGATLDENQVMRSHLRFYRNRPDVLAAAVDEHEASLRLAGLWDLDS